MQLPLLLTLIGGAFSCPATKIPLSPFQSALPPENSILLGQTLHCVPRTSLFSSQAHPVPISNTILGKGVQFFVKPALKLFNNESPCQRGERRQACRIYVKEWFWANYTRGMDKFPKLHLNNMECSKDTPGKFCVHDFRAGFGEFTATTLAHLVGLQDSPAVLYRNELFLPEEFAPFLTQTCHVPFINYIGNEEWFDSDLNAEEFKDAKALASRRVFAVGDVHGDYMQTMRVFRMLNLTDVYDRWVGGDSVLVQVGDVVDRGDDTKYIYQTLARLRLEAQSKGGNVVRLLGNHEILNIAKYLNYVTYGDFQAFGGIDERFKAFSVTGSVGSYMFRLPIVYQFYKTLFVHAGITKEYAEKYPTIEQLNQASRDQMPLMAAEKTEYDKIAKWPIFFEENSPVWYRGYAESQGAACEQLSQVLEQYKVERMIVGHTPQVSGEIGVRCNGKYVIADVGISSVYGGNVAAVEITNDGVLPVYEL